MAILKVENLTVAYGRSVIVEDVSLTLEQGEMVALIGPNGAGKTTLLRAVLGLTPIRSGTVLLFGKPMSKLKEERAWIGYVPQRLELDRTIPITVQEFMQINTPPRFLSRESVQSALTEVDGERLLNRQVGELSGGELQRMLIAANLIHEPRLMFLDEPATGIDQEGEQRFYDVLERLRETRKMAVLMVSHDISVVYSYASRVLCINRRLMCQGPPREILNEQTLEQLYGHAASIYHHHDN
jgi:zinc transport system ATP-binding protein